jgi:hypothetical protein
MNDEESEGLLDSVTAARTTLAQFALGARSQETAEEDYVLVALSPPELMLIGVMLGVGRFVYPEYDGQTVPLANKIAELFVAKGWGPEDV